jgi:hypothetical protein
MRFMYCRTWSIGLFLILILLLAGCSWTAGSGASSPAHTSMHTSSSIHELEVDLLTNIKENGFDNNGHDGSGLWINWRYGTQPLQTNINGTGEPDGAGVSPPRHDELIDLRYIHNLWSYW